MKVESALKNCQQLAGASAMVYYSHVKPPSAAFLISYMPPINIRHQIKAAARLGVPLCIQVDLRVPSSLSGGSHRRGDSTPG